MKSIRHTLIASSLLIGLSGLAMAQSAPANAPETKAPRAEHMEKMRQHMGEHHAKHLAELKTKLKLEPAQEGAWSTFAQSMQAPGSSTPRLDPAALEKLSTPERLDQMQAHKAQRDALMQKHVEATKTFYATLSAEQKKTFDAETAQAMRHMHGDMQRGGHHGPR